MKGLHLTPPVRTYTHVHECCLHVLIQAKTAGVRYVVPTVPVTPIPPSLSSLSLSLSKAADETWNIGRNVSRSLGDLSTPAHTV